MRVKKAGMMALWSKICLVGLLFLVAGTVKSYASDADLWQTANKLYAQKNYDSAVDIYQSLLRNNAENAALHYNAGNAYYRLNKIGAAVFHYEKAAHLDPGNKNISDNLALARARVADNNLQEGSPIFFVVWWNALNHAVSANAWAVLTFTVFLVLLALVYLSRVKKGDFNNAGRWIALAAVCFVICGAMSWISFDERSNPDTAVVLTTNTLFLQNPQTGSRVIGSLPEGLVIEVLDKQGNYYKVALNNGKNGWVAMENLGVI